MRLRGLIGRSRDTLAKLVTVKNEFSQINSVLLDDLTRTTSEEVRKVITSMSIATCDLEPISTSPLTINRRSTKAVGVYYKSDTGLLTNANRSCNNNTPKARGVQIKHAF